MWEGSAIAAEVLMSSTSTRCDASRNNIVVSAISTIVSTAIDASMIRVPADAVLPKAKIATSAFPLFHAHALIDIGSVNITLRYAAAYRSRQSIGSVSHPVALEPSRFLL